MQINKYSDLLFQSCIIVIMTIILIYSIYTPSLFHSLILIYSNKFAFIVYNILISIIICFISNIICIWTLGTLNESDQSQYNEITLEYLSNISMTAVLFPYTLMIRNLVPFTILYNIRSFSTIYHLLTNTNNTIMIFVVFFIIYQLFNLVSLFSLTYMSFNGLLAFEYFLILFYVLKDMCLRYFKDRSPVEEFTINIIYLILRILVIGIYAKNLSQFRMPITYLKMLIQDIQEFKKKVQIFYNYVKLCKELDTIEDVTLTETEICAICTDEIKNGKKLGCKHIFHTECLKIWCERETTCPICRKPLTLTNMLKFETNAEIINVVPL